VVSGWVGPGRRTRWLVMRYCYVGEQRDIMNAVDVVA
jgi:hypothetical protein